MVQMVKNLPTILETGVWPLDREDPLGKEMATHSSILAWNSHGWRNLAGYSPWDCEESDMAKWLHFNQNFCLQLMHKQTESICD